MGTQKSGRPAGGIPTGTVAFLFTDIEGSTRLWELQPGAMTTALQRHDELVRAAIEDNQGYVFSLAGDQFVAAFHDVPAALSAAGQIQSRIASEPWPDSTPIRVRVGLHVGVADERDGDYFGAVLNRTARVMSAAHGGQTVLSAAAAQLADASTLIDLGSHRLKDLAEAEHIWQVGDAVFPPLRTLQTARHNLPVERTELVGRESDVTAIAKAVLEHSVVTLLGLGGTGKTRLGRAVAAELADRFGDGTWFVDLVPASDSAGVVEAVANAAGLRLGGTNLLEALASHCSGREILFVFDNCEHLIDEAADVVDHLVERAPGVRVLATSREPLEVHGEQQVRVAPLAHDESFDAPAVRLFVDGARRVGIELGPNDVGAVSHICQRLDGLPLSIELAAAQLRQMSLTDLAGRLDQRFDLLARSGRRQRQGRHTSLLDVLTDSWDLLDDDEQRVLHLLAAFPSSFDYSDVEDASGEPAGTVVRALGGLRDRSLVSSDGSGRSRLLETVKLFVRQRWHGDEADDRFEAHTRWVLDKLRRDGSDNANLDLALAGWAMAHYDDHRAVEDRLARTGRFVELAELLWMLRWLYSRETPQRAAALISRIEGYLDTFSLADPEAAVLHMVAGRAGRAAKNAKWIENGAERAVELLRPLGPSRELVTAVIGATFFRSNLERYSAHEMLDEARSLAEQIGDPTLTFATHGYRANYLAMKGDIEEATAALDALKSRPDPHRADQLLVMQLEAEMLVNLRDDPSRSLAAIERLLDTTAEHGLDHDWHLHLHVASGAAVTGDIAGTARLVDRVLSVLDQSSLTGLPDLLLPYMALAGSTGDIERCRRWLTAVRRGPGVLGTGISIGVYRNYRLDVGLEDLGPLDAVGMQQILHEAQEWLADLVGGI